MNKPKSIKELCEFIWYLEDKYDLLDFEVDGVKVWQYSRMSIYYTFAKKLNILTEPHQTLSKMDKLKYSFKYFFNSIFYNPFFSKEVPIIIFPNQRLKKVNNKFIDIYTYYFKDRIKNKDYIEISFPYNGEHLKHSKSEYFGDIFILARNLLVFKKDINFTSYENFINQINNQINNKLNIDFDLKQVFNNNIKQYNIEYFLYKRLFQKQKTKKIYLTVSYGKGSLIKAAKDLNIDIYEFQHGTFSKYHLGYSFPNRKDSLEYFPDNFLVWNNFWKNLIKLPIANENIIEYGFEYMESLKLEYAHLEQNDKQIVVLSQGAITDKIVKETIKNIYLFSSYKIIYKLHPGEFNKWRKNKYFKELLKFNNVQVIENCDLYELFASSKYVIGVFSTAIYEAIEFNCEVLLYDLTGIEYMEDIIKQKKVKIFNKENFSK